MERREEGLGVEFGRRPLRHCDKNAHEFSTKVIIGATCTVIMLLRTKGYDISYAEIAA